MSESRFSEGFLIGAIIGAAAGFFAAAATSDDWKRRFRKLKTDSEDLMDETKSRTENLIYKTREAIDTGLDKLSKMVDERRQAKTHVEK